jgi:hypothetical protein
MAKKTSRPAKPKDKSRCGIVMPISAMPDCPKAHWEDVLQIIREALEETFSVDLVSDADETRVIQGRIVQSLYEDPIVVCDVSCRNSNVMFELGIRIALDKPVVVIKDDVTDFSFDYSPLAHLIYPRSLAYKEICAFKSLLSITVTATLEASKKADYQSFLKTFAPSVVAGRLDARELSESQLVAEKLDNILAQLSGIGRGWRPTTVAVQSDDAGAPTELAVGQRIRVKEGALMGLEGTVVETRAGGRLLIKVKFLSQHVTVMVQEFQVEPLV